MNPTIRPATPADQDRVADFLQALSVDTAYRRFLTGLGHPSASMLRQLVRHDRDHGTFIAEVDGTVVGHALWSRTHDGSAELGVVVTDDWQHRGVGSQLTIAALNEAVARGVTHARMSVHRGNGPTIDIVHHAWPQADAHVEDGMLVYDVPLAA
jgi:acetyltransferase